MSRIPALSPAGLFLLTCILPGSGCGARVATTAPAGSPGIASRTPTAEEVAATTTRLKTLTGLAGQHRRQGRYREAEPLLLEALALAEAFYGSEDLEVADVLNGLGVLYKYMARFEDAERVYQRALAIIAKTAPDDLLLATLYHNLGGLEHARGRHAAGEPYARRSVEIREARLGPDDPEVAEDLAALAALLDGQRKFEESERIYRRVLEIFAGAYGPESYDVAVNLNNLAALCAASGRPKEAEAHYRRSVAMKEHLLGADHPDLAVTLNNLAMLYKAEGRTGEAAPLLRRALSISEKALGPDHPQTLTCRANLMELTAASTEPSGKGENPD